MATPEITEAQLIATWTDQTLTRKEQAARLGLTVNSMTKRARKLRLPMREQVDKRSDMVIVTDAQVRHIWVRSDLSRVEQAKAVGITVGALRERANKLKLPMRRIVRDRRIPASKIREVWLDPSLTGQQAADLVGLTRVNLQLRAKSLGLPPRKQGARFAIVGDDQRALFAEMWEAPVKADEIAEHFDIHIMTVSSQARRMKLSKRTHPSRLISLEQFWAKRQEDRLRQELTEAAQADMQAQRRYKRDDFYADPSAQTPEEVRDRAVKQAIRAALKAGGTTIADLARELDLKHQAISLVVYGDQSSARVEEVIAAKIGRPIAAVRAEAAAMAVAAE